MFGHLFSNCFSFHTTLICFPSSSGPVVSALADTAGPEGFKHPNQLHPFRVEVQHLLFAVLNLAGFGPLRSTIGRRRKSHMPY